MRWLLALAALLPLACGTAAPAAAERVATVVAIEQGQLDVDVPELI